MLPPLLGSCAWRFNIIQSPWTRPEFAVQVILFSCSNRMSQQSASKKSRAFRTKSKSWQRTTEANTILHLCNSSAGEANHQDAAWVEVVFAEEFGDTSAGDGGFAGAR